MMKILRKNKLKKNKFEKNKSKKIFSGFSSFRQQTLDMGVFNRFMESPDCKDLKNAMEEVNFRGTGKNPLLGVLGAWLTFKNAEMAKTLRNGLSMIETNPLNHKWFDFAI